MAKILLLLCPLFARHLPPLFICELLVRDFVRAALVAALVISDVFLFRHHQIALFIEREIAVLVNFVTISEPLFDASRSATHLVERLLIG